LTPAACRVAIDRGAGGQARSPKILSLAVTVIPPRPQRSCGRRRLPPPRSCPARLPG
jgi:hypothetical protein